MPKIVGGLAAATLVAISPAWAAASTPSTPSISAPVPPVSHAVPVALHQEESPRPRTPPPRVIAAHEESTRHASFGPGASAVEEMRPSSRSLAAIRLGPSSSSSSSPKFTERELTAYRQYNHEIASASPAPIRMVLDDPDHFVADLQGRFAKQKELTPSDPYTFEFGDYGLPVLSDIKGALDGKIAKVADELKKLESAPPAARLLRHSEIEEHRQGLDYLRALQHDVSSHLDGKSISYRRLNELGYFSSRALGYFDHADLSMRDRVYLEGDRALQGYRKASITEERRRYEQNEFTVFQGTSPVKGFKAAQEPFERAFFNKEKLEIIALPTMLALNRSQFMRLLPYDIYLVGVTDKPIAADGFVRPGGDFWLHDIRHSSDIFERRQDYQVEHRLSPVQMNKLQKSMDIWSIELNKARAEIKDPELKNAIDMTLFNFHHDQGFPLVPSVYAQVKPASVRTTKLLYGMYKVSGQSGEASFDHPNATIDRAYGWLREFWMPRLEQEKAIWGDSARAAAPIVVKSPTLAAR